jgi:hypothetical protein
MCRISLNALKRYNDSNEILMAAKKAGSKDKSLDIWISKNTRELAKCIIHNGECGLTVVSEEEKKSNIDVIPKSLHYSTESMVL